MSEINLGRKMNYKDMLINISFLSSGWTINKLLEKSLNPTPFYPKVSGRGLTGYPNPDYIEDESTRPTPFVSSIFTGSK